MKLQIQKADLAELDLLMTWRMRVLREVFSVPETDAMFHLARENRLYYERAIPDGHHIACFARIEQRVVGCGGICIYQEMPSPDNPSGQCAYLMNIYTLPSMRSQGVGRKVAGWLINQARSLGITKIYLETSKSGRPLYTKLGFTDMADYMQLSNSQDLLPDPAGECMI